MRSRRAVLALVALVALSNGLVQAQAAPKAKPRFAAATSERPCTDWGMYGGGLTRRFSREQCPSHITRTTVATLLPAWAVKTKKTVTASPVIAGGSLFVGAWDGVMTAYDAATGKVRWSYQTSAADGAAFGPIVSTAAVANVQGRDLVVFGSGPVLYALDAKTGKRVWSRAFNHAQPVATTPVEIESSPAIYGDTVYVGLNTHDHPAAQSGGVTGAMLALDVRTGAIRWRFQPDPFGHGCGGVWGSPSIDVKRNRVIFGTANCNDAKYWTHYTEAIIALDATTGRVAWSYQPSTPNVRDEDFGATPNLYRDRNGVDVVGVGKKDARYYVVRADNGRFLRRTKVAEPGDIQDGFAIGGFLGSPAILGGNVFGGTAIGGPPFFHSIDGTTGAIRWSGVSGPVYSATAGVNDVVFNAGLDSTLKAYDSATGVLLWASPLLGPSSSGAAIVGDMVYVGSGTSSTDACAKDLPGSDVCLAAFDAVLGSLGGVQAFKLAG
ncbi:MAG: putative PQQ-dependent dehydrogenase [Frankiales bacterium]|nr:putative PQQ-dependent dehydrogenase [Frankiales bacterium]